MSWREDALIEYAETEANEIARCLYNFRHPRIIRLSTSTTIKEETQ